MNRQSLKNTSITFTGHFAIDHIIRFKRLNKPSLGGSTTFCSLALSEYINNVDIRIISHIGKLNFNISLLDKIKNKNIDLSGIKYSQTENTNFVLDYFDHKRSLTLNSRSPNLDFNDIPTNFFRDPPDAFVLVPLCNEISYEYISQILKKFPKTYIGIDLQGFIRKIENDGKVKYVYDEEIIANMENIIELIGDRLILKGSEEEMKLIARKCVNYNDIITHYYKYKNNGIYIMTLGEKGSMLTRRDENILKIPAFKPKRVLDETGAGDVYFSIFLYEFIHSDKSWKSIEKAAYLASAAASFLVEKKGPAGFETKKAVLKRIKKKKYIY